MCVLNSSRHMCLCLIMCLRSNVPQFLPITTMVITNSSSAITIANDLLCQKGHFAYFLGRPKPILIECHKLILGPFFTTLLPLWKMSQLFFTAARDLETLDLVSINEDHGPQIPCSPFANYVRLELKSASILGLVENRPTLHALSFLAITIFYISYMRNTTFTKVNQILCVRF